MGRNWEAKALEIHNKLADAGIMFSFSRKKLGIPDPITGERVEDFVEKYTSPGIMRRDQSINNEQWGSKNSALANMQGVIQHGDEQLMIAAITYKPELEDKVDIDGEEWTIKSVSTLRPAVVPLLHYLVIKKG